MARVPDIITIGIDAEPNRELPEGVLDDVTLAEERASLRDLGSVVPDVYWDRLLFSAKESVYKAWFPLARRWLGFEDAVLTIDPCEGTFSAHLLVPGPKLTDGQLTRLGGRWLARDGLVMTAIALAPPESSIAQGRPPTCML
jgi:4'-phosphopantetheinyl transferase EntD